MSRAAVLAPQEQEQGEVELRLHALLALHQRGQHSLHTRVGARCSYRGKVLVLEQDARHEGAADA